MSTVIAIVVLLIFFGGNAALLSGDTEGVEFAVAVAVIADLAMAIWLLSVIGKAIGSSYEKRCERNLFERKKFVVKEIGNKISHRNEIQQTFDRHFEKIERQFSLVSLISSCMGNNNQELKNLLLSNKEKAFISTKNEVFDKLSKAEKKRFPKSVVGIVDYKKTLEQEISELKTDLSSVATADDEQLSILIKKHCPEVHKSMNRKRIKLIAKIVIPIIIIITLVASVKYIQNAPYRKLHSMIEEQSLTAEMLEYNKDNKDSYYDLIHSEKGYEFLASELTELHRKNDIKKAMWLLCIQPGCIDGIDVCASDSFIDWVVDYARENGTKETDLDSSTYSVDGYEITISSAFDLSIGHYFRIRKGRNGVSVNNRNIFHEGHVPTIQ